MIEFKPYVFLVNFKQWRISLWDPIYWTRSEQGLKIGGDLNCWEDQKQYDVSFLVDSETTARIEEDLGLEIEPGALSMTFQKGDVGEEERRVRHEKLMRMTDGLWLACKYSAIRTMEGRPLSEGHEGRFAVGDGDLPWRQR